MPHVPVRFLTQEDIAPEVDRAIQQLGPEVVRIRYQVGTDWDGDPSIDFRVVLKDDAAKRENIGKVAQGIRNFLIDRLQPRGNWDLIPYFNFRSESEQANRHEPEWS